MKNLFISLRPKQWIKNLVVFAGIIFSRNLADWSMQWKTWCTFFAFCAVVSAGYLINDILDRESDRHHPVKKYRPIASGSLSVGAAVTAVFVLVLPALIGGYFVDHLLPVFLAGYMVLQFSYSMYLKHLVIVDVMVIAAGFVIRAVAGAAVIHVPISSWLVVCTMLLALFLGLAKRRAELVLLEDDAASHRANLEHYSLELIDQMISVTASATLVSYALYTFTAFPDSHSMMWTIPFVLYGIFRYLSLVHTHLRGGSPEQVMLTDKPLLIDVVLWVITVVAALKLN
ncbi:MAG: decaprenyl-phosphate phosphoribosyltransferase [Thermoleophilia bacterium]|nr:decaprenyl-phosphate phosphoribosyltransferase [Thermoleophilia bacterium]